MKYLYALAFVTIAMISCKKDRQKHQLSDGELSPVSFNINGFTQVTGEINGVKTSSVKVSAASPSEIKAGADHIYYIVYNQDETFVKIKHQTRADPNFGVITDSLAQGIYRFVFLATKDSVRVVPNLKYAEFTIPGTDTFFKSTLLAVDTQPDKRIFLDRIVALLQLKTEDPVPFSVKRIGVRLFNQSNRELFRTMNLIRGTPEIGNSNKIYNLFIDIKSNEYNKPLVKNIYFFGITEPAVGPSGLTLELGTQDSTNEPIRYVRINNLNIKNNKKTILSGVLFGTRVDGAVINLPDITWEELGTINF